MAVGSHIDQAHIGHPAAAAMLVLGFHAESRQGLVVAAQLRHQVKARAHHVVAPAVKGGVMGVTLGAAGGHGDRHALGLLIHHLAFLLGTALQVLTGGFLGQHGCRGEGGGGNRE